MLTYCISCKKDTECISCEIAKTKNNRLLFRSVCKDCKKNKSKFYKGGSIDIHSKLMPLLPKNSLTLPGYNYCGPGNPLDNGNPVNELDAICERHDYCYSKPSVNKNDCDKVMLNEMKTSNSATLGEKLSKYLIVKPIIFSKYKLGLGTKSVPLTRWSDKLAEELLKAYYKEVSFKKGHGFWS